MTIKTRAAVSGPLPETVWDSAPPFSRPRPWTELEYLALETNHLVEFSDGHLEVLRMSTRGHQQIVLCLYRLLFEFVTSRHLGTLLIAPFRVRLWPGKFREPDLIFMAAAHRAREHNDYFEGADLVVEVVSGDASDRERDLVTKRDEYARARIPEYWLVDPQMETITVLTLTDAAYIPYGIFRRGETAHARLLTGFTVAVDVVLDAALV